MSREPTLAELEAALAANFDADGNDMSLAEDVAAMSPEDRAESEQNLRVFIEGLRSSMVRGHR